MLRIDDLENKAVLVTGASTGIGAAVSRRRILEADDAWVDAVFNLNARVVIGTSQAAYPHMDRRGGGAIINVGSIAGQDGGGPGTGVWVYITGQIIHVSGGQVMP